ncbi:MAG TPA: hypothetical protein VE482_11755 [Candidatus Eisenbacteria bacterium]|jgi:hypothetical protein|nr:hypothetical protein [Candidatus Eisenbacteria bacterium]
MDIRSRYLREGIIAGLIAAAIVAVWFLIYDAARGQPFRTPALLGAAVQGMRDPGAVIVTPGLVAQYTVLHGAIFAMVGVLIAFLISTAQRQPSRLLVMFIALMCFEVAFLAVMTWWAHPVVTALGWWAILIANALAAGGMLVYLFVGYRSLGGMLFGPWTRIVREGLAAGLLGAAAVALWFLLYDTAAGVPLRTPALLGAALFHGLRDPSALVIGWPLVLEYTLFHGAAFVAFGWMAAGMLALADREPRLLFAFIMLFCCFEVFTFVMISVLAHWLLETIAWWTILAGNLLASVIMLGCFLRGHRVAWREFLHAPM